MSKKSWRLVGWGFLVLSLVVVFGLAAADFSEINQADPKYKGMTGRNPLSKPELKQRYIPRTPILVSTSRHLIKQLDTIPDCLQSR
jgi:hypothetical protein